MNMYQYVLLLFFLVLSCAGYGQEDFYKDYHFTKADTLRGMMRPERSCFDVTYYDLDIKIDVEKNSVHVHALADWQAKDITTAPHPGFPTDLQAQYMTLMTQVRLFLQRIVIS